MRLFHRRNTRERLARGRGPGGFTLIELLVVISIIALLLGILVPSLARARENGRRVKCLANLRGIGQGLQIYMDTEAKGVLLPKVRPINEGSNENDPSMLEIMANYLDVAMPFRPLPDADWVVTDPFRCPSDNGGVGSDARPTWAQIGWSYDYPPGKIMVAAELATVRNPQFGVSKAYEKNGRLPVVTDYDDWHNPRFAQLARENAPEEVKWDRNALFWGDWRADKLPFRSNAAENAGEFFMDVVQFGGGLGG